MGPKTVTITTTKTYVQCSNCLEIIRNYRDGVIVQGQITTADVENPSVLLGFLDENDSKPFSQTDKNGYCLKCFFGRCGLE